MNIVKLLLWPFSFIYSLALRLRHWSYDSGFFASTTFKTPTICVGNLSLGGTGKTPMIELLLRYFNTQQKDPSNYCIAVLSRGYGRKSKGVVEASSLSTVEDLGDEPYQIAQSFPANRVVVSSSRVAGMTYLEQSDLGQNLGLVLLDDAFQHRAISPSLSILLTSFHRPFPADDLLPLGTLRDLPSRASSADLIVVTKCPLTLSNDQRVELINRISPSANPEPLLTYLNANGIDVLHKKYVDHHFFTSKEIEELATIPKIICTEKDFVKLKDSLENLYYIPVEHHFFKEDQIGFYQAISTLQVSKSI
jgi:tetraacyldisaccharide 4'-kinase